jgi:hypothetical protein
MKKVAILQSNYIPWKGYFDLINMVDEFIVYDEAQYTKSDWRNRNKIKTKNGLLWLTIPVRRKKLNQNICNTYSVNPIWRKKHWKSFCQWYSKSRYFNDFRDAFEKMYLSSNENNLSKINIEFIIEINRILGIETKITMSSEYECSVGKTNKLVDICIQAGATDYLSGPLAKNYLNLQKFEKNNVKVRYVNYEGYTRYNQQFPPFDHHVSILDLILNEGPFATMHMKSF